MTPRLIWQIATGVVCFVMGASGIAYVLHAPFVVHALGRLGYPPYFMGLLGTAKLLGVLTLALPMSPPWLKSWAYAGFTFDTIGAVWSSVSAGGGIADWLPPLVILVLVQVAFWQRFRGGTAASDAVSESAA